jgi:hypothetical protein
VLHNAVLDGRSIDGSKRVRLPDAALGEAEEVVLANLPGVLVVLEIESENVAMFFIGESSNGGLSSLETHVSRGKVVVVEVGGSKKSESTVDEPEKERWQQETLKLLPVTPAGTNVNHGEDIVRLAEELVACHANAPGSAADEKEKQQGHGHNTPDHVLLDNPVRGNVRLRLVKLNLNNAPSNGVKATLDKDDITQPAVHEDEALVRHACDEREDRLPTGQKNRQRS